MIQTTEIARTEGLAALGMSEVWRYRDLLYFLAARDIKVRYKQTVFGIGWALLQPLLLMTIFTLFLGRLAGVPSEGIPYAPFVFAALVPWTLFSQAVTGASNSLVESRELVSKVYFPRLLLPLASTLSFVIDFVISLVLLIGLMLVYEIPIGINVVWLPLFIALALLTALSAGTWLSAINARFRDVKYALPFLVQAWLFLSPVAYPVELVPQRWQLLYAVNPMVGVIEGFRWALLGTNEPRAGILMISMTVALIAAITGAVYFKSTERTIADVI